MSEGESVRKVIVCVGALLVRGDEVLLGRRAAHKSHAGCWDVLGGHVEAGESAEAALSRELREEAGVTPLAWRLVAIFPFDEGGAEAELRVYRIDQWDGDPHVVDDEHVELRWHTIVAARGLDRLASDRYPALFDSLDLRPRAP